MENSVNLSQPIFFLKTLEDGTIAVMDQHSTLRLIDPLTFKTVGGFKAKLSHEHRILNIMDVSYKGKYTLIGVPKKNKAALFLTKEKKLKYTLGLHKGEIESVATSNDEQYLATGGTDGKVLVYHHASKTPIIMLPPRADYITCISFSEDSYIIAYGSFDRTITVKNIALMSDEFVLKGHQTPIKKLCFLSSQKLLAADKDGGLVIWDLHTRKVFKRLPKMLEEILDITVTQDKRFLFASTVYGNIGLYDLETFKCIEPHYVKIKGRINALCISHMEHKLFYASQEGELSSFNLLSGEPELEEALLKKDYEKAYEMVSINILLRFSNFFKELEEIWEKALRQAKQLYAKGLNDTAEHVLSAFANVAGKRTLVKAIKKEFEEFEKFKMLVEHKKYALAYSLASQHKLYEDTPEYEEMEAVWEAQFAKAKKSILKRSGEDEAREHLALFRGVSHKAKQITALYDQRKVYILFRNKLASKDFTALFQLVQQHPFLEDFKELADIKRWADLVYIKIHEAYLEQDYLTAIKYAHAIKDVPEFKDEVSALIIHSQVFIDFKQALQSGHLDKVYELLASNSFLADLPAIRGIDPQWDHILDAIDKPMSEGDMKGVLKLLKDYPYLKYKKQHIMVFIKSTYMAQLETAIEEDRDVADVIVGFQNLYEIFGKDDLLLMVVRNYEKMKSVKVDFSHCKAGSSRLFSLDYISESIFDR